MSTETEAIGGAAISRVAPEDKPLAAIADGLDGWHHGATKILLDVAEAMTTADGEAAALNRLAVLALEATGADRCAILVKEPSGRPQLLPAAGASRTGEDQETLWRRFRSMEPIEMTDDPRRFALWQVPRTVTLTDAASSELIPQAWRRVWGSKSVAFAALRAGGDTYGLLALDYVTRTHEFSPAETRLLEAIASAAGVALRSARLVGELHHALEVERRLSECSSAVQVGRSLPEVLGLVMDGFSALLRGTSCSILLFGPNLETIAPVAFRGTEPRVSVVRIADLPRADVEFVRQHLTQHPNAPLSIPDVGTLRGWEHLIPPEIGPGLLIPLRDGEDLLGFVAVGRRHNGYTADEIRVASAFAGQAALALTQARMNDELAARLKVIEALQHLSDLVANPRSIRRIIHLLNESVCHHIGVECTRIVLVDAYLAGLLRARLPDEEETKILRGWKVSAERGPRLTEDGRLSLPLVLSGRPAGMIWFRTQARMDTSTLEVLRSIASGLGDIAYKIKLRKTAERRLQHLTAAAERERIARDLHDTAGQTFYGIGLKLQDLMADVTDPDLASRLAEIRTSAAQAVADVRSAVYALSFLHVRDKGLIASLRTLARQFESSTGILTELKVEGRLPRLNGEAIGALYRVAHEALVNVERHARATGVVIALSSSREQILLNVRDDGVGLDQRQGADWRSAAHFGLRTMSRAIRDAGGQFVVVSAEPRGLVIRASLPVANGRKKR